MSALELLRTVVLSLEASHVPYMLVGSFASGAHGAQRSTQDIDIVIDPTAESLARFVASFDDQEFYIGPSPQEALRLQDQFNLISTTSSWKVDLIVLSDHDFDRTQFSRRSRVKVLGLDVWVASPEDTVLAKLLWAAMGESDRQLEDAAGVLKVREAVLDHAYLDRWAADLGVTELLQRARSLGG